MCCLISAAKIDLDGVVVFTYNDQFYKKYIPCIGAIDGILRNQEVIQQVENNVRVWQKQIERVIILCIKKYT